MDELDRSREPAVPGCYCYGAWGAAETETAAWGSESAAHPSGCDASDSRRYPGWGSKGREYARTGAVKTNQAIEDSSIVH